MENPEEKYFWNSSSAVGLSFSDFTAVPSSFGHGLTIFYPNLHIIEQDIYEEPLVFKTDWVPQTKLGVNLLEIRSKAIQAGEAPVSIEELDEELSNLRKDPEDCL